MPCSRGICGRLAALANTDTKRRKAQACIRISDPRRGDKNGLGYIRIKGSKVVNGIDFTSKSSKLSIRGIKLVEVS